jgi:hypothetical protein
MSPAGNWSGVPRKFQRRFKFKKNPDLLTKRVAVLLFECAVVDLQSAFIKINSAALGVACSPPGIGAKK